MNNSQSIKQYFNIPTHKPVSFVNANCSTDIPCFVDPALLFGLHVENFNSQQAMKKINSFFHKVLTLYRSGNSIAAAKLFTQFSENGALGLGYSKGSKKGHGLSEDMLINFFNKVNQLSKLSDKTLTDPAIYRMYIQQFDNDRFTDLITTIISYELVEYTQLESAKLGIPLTYSLSSNYYWDGTNFQKLQGLIPSVNNEGLILIPYRLLTKRYRYTIESFIRSMIIPSKQAKYATEHNNKTITANEILKNIRNQYANNGGLKQYALDELEKSQQLLSLYIKSINRDNSLSHSLPLSSEDDVA